VTSDQGRAPLQARSFEVDTCDSIDNDFEDQVVRRLRDLVAESRDNPGGTYISGRVAAHLVEAHQHGRVLRP
jgi:hypothetical protein